MLTKKWFRAVVEYTAMALALWLFGWQGLALVVVSSFIGYADGRFDAEARTAQAIRAAVTYINRKGGC